MEKMAKNLDTSTRWIWK